MASLAPLDRQLADGAKAPALAASRRRCEATQALQEAVQRSLELALRTVEELRRCDAISPALVAAPASSPVAEPQAVDEAAEQSAQTVEPVVEQQAAMEPWPILEATDPRGREHARCPQVRS